MSFGTRNFPASGCAFSLRGSEATSCNTVPQADYVFPSWEDGMPFGSFPRQWTKLLKDTDLAGITPHVLRHSFASIGNDLGFTEATIAALVGHSRGTVTSRYIHTVDTALIMTADSIAGYIQGLLDGVAFTHTAYALDRDSRKAALATS
jgi:integrase